MENVNASALEIAADKYKHLVTIREAAEILPFSEKTFRNWRAEGKYGRIFVRVFGKVMVDLSEVDLIIEVEKKKTVSEIMRLGLDD